MLDSILQRYIFGFEQKVNSNNGRALYSADILCYFNPNVSQIELLKLKLGYSAEIYLSNLDCS